MIKRVLTSVFLALFLAAQLLPQNRIDSLFYKRFEGSLGTNINVTTHIVRIFDKLSGNYFYIFTGQDGQKQYGKTIEINGVFQDDSLKLREFGNKHFSFNGILNDDRFTGTWHGPNDKDIDFEFSEYYPKGSMTFGVHYLKSEHFLDKKDVEAPSANIELTLIYPTGDYFLPKIGDSVKNDILKSYFGRNFQKRQVDSMLYAFEKEYYDNFDNENRRLYTENHKSFSWEKTITMSVLFNSNYLLSIEYLRYAYSGGSRGMTNTSYDVVNLRNGSLLDYSSVFKKNAVDSLSILLTNKLRHNYKISNDISLKKAGFFVDTIRPNHNIYINGNGVGFVYNVYEIAPPSSGTINIFLRFRSIKNIIAKSTPVYPLSCQY